jgi:hypothetical protein
VKGGLGKQEGHTVPASTSQKPEDPQELRAREVRDAPILGYGQNQNQDNKRANRGGLSAGTDPGWAGPGVAEGDQA